MMSDFWKNLRDIVSEDTGGRGIQCLSSVQDLIGAVETLRGARKVAIFTGFVIRRELKGETDGPVGALFLARGLLTMGKDVSIWTDFPHYDVLKVGLSFLGINIPLYEVPLSFGGEVISTFWRENFDLLISVERPGRAIDGRYYSYRGEDVSPYTSPLDEFFLEGRRRGVPTIGIGDGGNEIGMGKVRSEILESLPNGDKVSTIVSTDYLLICGISNWGAYALLAGLSKLEGVNELLPDPGEEIALIERVVEAGAIDGVLVKPTATVDGLPQEVLRKKLKEMGSCLRG